MRFRQVSTIATVVEEATSPTSNLSLLFDNKFQRSPIDWKTISFAESYDWRTAINSPRLYDKPDNLDEIIERREVFTKFFSSLFSALRPLRAEKRRDFESAAIANQFLLLLIKSPERLSASSAQRGINYQINAWRQGKRERNNEFFFMGR